jgi:lysine-specific demethylase/histidyl-hydroxylase NO66
MLRFNQAAAPPASTARRPRSSQCAMDFAELIAPLTPEAFMAEHYGRKPIHIPAPEGSARRDFLGWERLNDLLGILSHWSEANLKLITNQRPVYPEFYLDEVATAAGTVRRADPAKIDLFLAMGASLVADAVDEIAPEVRRLCDSLADRFAAKASANLYCSFRAVQAFGSHCDLSEVFALHCEGEKVWRLYENRADRPIDQPSGGEEAQAEIDAAKGRVAMEVRMRPGDVLYIPRGWYHDALASSEASLHLSMGVFPLYGRILFRLLEEEAMADSAFRDYLPDARAGDALAAHVAGLGERLAAMARSRRFLARLEHEQRRLRSPDYRLDLPRTVALEFFARTGRPAELIEREEGSVLRAAGADLPLGSLAPAAAWALGRPAFSVQELFARYPQWPREELRGLAESLVKAGLFAPYKPALQ